MTDNTKHALKAIFYLVGYWAVFVVLPFISVRYFLDKQSGIYDFLCWLLMYHILLLTPLLFFIPYKLSKLSESRQKRIYIIIGLVIPYIAIYSYAYYGLTHMQIGLF